ncbi:TonB-dependent receptor [Vibrio panuliri]|uniref:TonB-dependent receptor n=1 Tax=Vibrio panuliri TaxID=1381081 RepID=A0ABX3FK17_9VIBR|nr:TonB-dependent receptor [Vibrio panuliri]KAB1457868.1 TonB-dependent receptor [Vibrio panuliri]OLQ94505.1 hypothetical protein BIY20_07660 [Vibrio panuliri]
MKTIKCSEKSTLRISITAVIGASSVFASTYVLGAPLKEINKPETIVVVGERIDKSLRDTTTAVTVIGEELTESGELKDINELATIAPNVVDSGFGTISIRGIDGSGAAVGGYAFFSGARPRVSTIVDGITQSWSGYGFTPSRAWDVKQVEVLRGPQSTAQGTNAIGGALIVQTNDPTYHWESKVRVGGEQYKNNNVKGNLAVMLSGPLIEDELAFRIAIDGTKGEGWLNYKQANNEFDYSPDLDDSENINGRAKLLWQPKNIPGLSAKLTYNKQSHEGEYLNWATEYDEETLTLDAARRSLIRLQDSTVETIAADINYEISEGITNALHIGYLMTDVRFDQYPNNARVFNVMSDIDNLTLENRLLFDSPGSDWQGVAGLYYSKNKTMLQVYRMFDGPNETITSAAFGEVTYTLTPSLKVVGGARFENEKIDRELDYLNTTNDFSQDTSENIFLPKLGLIYYLNDQTTFNSTIRKGYNAGGASVNWDTNAYYTYDEETVIAYEMGLLTQFDSGQLSANLFYNDYTDYQAFVQSAYIANINDARTYGLELEANMWVTNSTQLRGSVGYLKSEVLSDDQSFSGSELPNAPEINVAAGFTQYIGENFSFGSDVYFVGEYYSDLANTDEYKAGDYVSVDARVQYVINDFVIDGYVKNLTDEEIIYFNNSGNRAAIGQSRTFGVSGTYHF